MTQCIVTYDTTTKHRLTVAHDGQVRIKVAIGTPTAAAEYIVESLKKVAKQAQALEIGKTLRGTVDPKTKYNDIVLYTDSQKSHCNFSW